MTDEELKQLVANLAVSQKEAITTRYKVRRNGKTLELKVPLGFQAQVF